MLSPLTVKYAIVVVVMLAACEREPHDRPAPVPAHVPAPVLPPGPALPAVEFPRCLASYPLPRAPAAEHTHDYVVQRPGESVSAAFERWDAREQSLSKLSLDDLLRTATRDEVAAVLRDRILSAASDGLAPAERHILTVDVLSAEVSNGGLDQYFFNSSGDRALEARDGLVEIGPAPLVAVFDCALAAFPDGKPSSDRATRQQQLMRIDDAYADAFHVLDESFWAYPDRDESILDYVRSHVRELPNAAKPTRIR